MLCNEPTNNRQHNKDDAALCVMGQWGIKQFSLVAVAFYIGHDIWYKRTVRTLSCLLHGCSVSCEEQKAP